MRKTIFAHKRRRTLDFRMRKPAERPPEHLKVCDKNPLRFRSATARSVSRILMPERRIFHDLLLPSTSLDEPEGGAAPNGLRCALRSHAMYDARARRYIAWELALCRLHAHF